MWKHPTAYSAWGDEERAAIERVVASGNFTQGEEVRAFEREFADHHGKRHGIMVNSGSSANLVAVASLFHVKRNPLKRGDQAIVPAVAWSTTYAPLVQHGLDLVLVDCDPSWNANPDLVARFVNSNLIIACSILGSPTRLAAWRGYATEHGARFIEDNCESLGARTPAGNLCGTFGDLSTFSFFWSHQVSAIEGGMILTDDDELAGLCRMLRAHGWSRDVRPPETFQDEYDFRLFGYNVRGLELHAAIAREQLRKLPGFVAARRANLDAFRAATADLDGLVVQTYDGEPSPFGLPFSLPDPETRQKAVDALRLAGIDCRLPTGGSFRLHAYGAGWRDQETPKADEVHRCALFLGNAPRPMPEEIEAAVAVLKEVL